MLCVIRLFIWQFKHKQHTIDAKVARRSLTSTTAVAREHVIVKRIKMVVKHLPAPTHPPPTKSERSGHILTQWMEDLRAVARNFTSGERLEEWGLDTPPPKVRVKTVKRTMSQDDLDTTYRHMDFLYTWSNGSSITNRLKKYFLDRQPKVQYYNTTESDESWYIVEELDGVSGQFKLKSLSDLETFLSFGHKVLFSRRDRDSDELRHSVRSLHDYAKWHSGRILIYAPGNCPHWLDHATNFFTE